MSRIRTVKPSTWTDDKITECSPSARLLFIGSWNFADDYGNLDRSAKQLKAQVFPHDDLQVEPMIQELISAGLVVEYEADGAKYLHIKGFRKHQKIDKPSKPQFPPFIESEGTPETPPLLLAEPSPSPTGVLDTEGKGREGSDTPLPPFHGTSKLPNSETPAGSEELLWEIARIHPKNAKLKNATELPYNQSSILVQRIATDGDDVRRGTEAYRRKWDSMSERDRKFVEKEFRDPYLFWQSFAYREALKGEEKPQATAEDMLRQYCD